MPPRHAAAIFARLADAVSGPAFPAAIATYVSIATIS